jgi:mono/diheme cytochrome c family protein
MNRLKSALVLTLMTTMPATAFGQLIGDAEKGHDYAVDVCAECHAVRTGEAASPVPRAPRFEDVANTPGMTATALTVWLQSSHPTMPNIVMKDEEMRDVIQYILSLKSS